MTEQLRLFHDPRPPAPDPGEAAPDVEAGLAPLDEIFRLTPEWHTAPGFLALIEGIARFSAYSPLNGFLIHLQDREARRVATPRAWAQRHRRRLKPNARPIPILARSAPVLFVFDVRDTEGADPPAETPPPVADDRRITRAIDALARHCREENIAVRDAQAAPGDRALRVTPTVRKGFPGLERSARYLVLIEPGLAGEERYAAVVHALAHVFCGHLGSDRDAWWPERDDLDLEIVEVEAAATAGLVCGRRGLPRSAERTTAGLMGRDRALPPIRLSAVLHAAAHIEAMSRPGAARPARAER